MQQLLWVKQNISVLRFRQHQDIPKTTNLILINMRMYGELLLLLTMS